MEIRKLRNEIALREAQAARMIHKHERPERIYAVREPLPELREKLRLLENALWRARHGCRG